MGEPQRPDPDALIAHLRAQEQQTSRGKLRIYFGANAGVGKTWSMLSAAQRERIAGADILIGVVETHGRAETAALLVGLESLPLKEVEYRGRLLREFDLDAALARKPTTLLVDELAHSNVPGSRHAKRWQDVQELLAAGINVWTALNVQHLESLNGTVGAITGIRVHETVPDTVLDDADEVVLVDATPDELIARLSAGKVYVPQQADRAARSFFRKGNLIALREIALRRTAEHVEDDVLGWRVEQSGGAGTGVSDAWNTSGSILACVGPREDAAQTVRTAARLAGQLNVKWHAAYVETPRLQRLHAQQRDKILAVLQLAQELGAETAVLTGDRVAPVLAAQALQLNCATVVLGRPASVPWWQKWLPQQHVGRELAELAPSLDLVEAAHASSSRRLAQTLKNPRSRVDALETDEAAYPQWPGILSAVSASIVVTLLAMPFHGLLELTNIVMLYLVGVVAVAMRFGRMPAAMAALLNVIAFDFFFVSPRLSFAVSDVQYVVTFAVMLGVGLLVGQLTAGLRFAAGVSNSRERRAQSLFDLTRELSAALETRQVIEIGAAAVQEHFGGRAVVLAMDESDNLRYPDQLPEGLDRSVADWTLRQGQSAGLATQTLAAQTWRYVPLKAPMRVRGVLALEPANPRWLLIPEQAQQLETQARQIAIALERVHYVEVAQKAVLEVESERLRNALLGAVSHDVRTPLTALITLAESLQRAPAGERDALAQSIVHQSRQLNALVSNLLDMARLESDVSGQNVSVRRDWQSVEEVVGASIRAARSALGGMAVRTDLPADLPLVEFDPVLVERVLVNLLENAAKYGGAPIVVKASVTENTLVLEVSDHGAGLPVSVRGKEHTLFDKFTRGQAESATPGVGLGLAICKAVVHAHGGTIAAGSAPGGGASFTITLPRREPPPDPDMEAMERGAAEP